MKVSEAGEYGTCITAGLEYSLLDAQLCTLLEREESFPATFVCS